MRFLPVLDLLLLGAIAQEEGDGTQEVHGEWWETNDCKGEATGSFETIVPEEAGSYRF